MQYVGLILPIRIQYVCLLRAVFFHFKAFHVIPHTFHILSIFQYKGIRM